MSAAGASFYVTGGTMKPGAPRYVERTADAELLELALAGELCYVLTSRQMGKSSLMARTAVRLRERGTRAAVVDLTQIGSGGETDEEQWYYGMVKTIHRELGLAADWQKWWRANSGLGPVQRFVEYFREVALGETEGRLVIFIDEIDSTISLPFSDDFFAAIRACWNARASEAAFERLSFVLLGVATPGELIADKARTPFNVGRRVDLKDFTAAEAAGLARGLEDGERGEAVLERVLEWTGGQPFLTQELCRGVAELEGDGAEAVDRLVEERFLGERALRDEDHLSHVAARLLDGTPEATRRRLGLYRRVLRGRPVMDEPASARCAALKLAGVVKVGDDGALLGRNRLYERVFDEGWVLREMPVDWARRAVYGSLAAMLLMFVGWLAVIQPRPHVRALEIADEDYGVALEAYRGLRRNPLFGQERADELLARFWDRRALKAEREGNRDRALVATLQALQTADSDRRRREGEELAGSFENLCNTLRHVDDITTVTFSPDGETVSTGSRDNMARLWNADTGAPLGAPMQHESFVLAVAFSPGGETVLTGSEDNTARLWSADTGAPLGAPMQHDDSVVAVAFSPDGETVLTGSSTARLWRADSGEPIGQPMRHDGWVYAVAFSPDGETILARTPSWLHVHAATPEGLEHRASRFFGTSLTNAFHFPKDSPDTLKIAVRPTANSLRIETIHLFEPDAPPIEGDPEALLEDWLQRLALRFDENMDIVPRWPVGSAGGSR